MCVCTNMYLSVYLYVCMYEVKNLITIQTAIERMVICIISNHYGGDYNNKNIIKATETKVDKFRVKEKTKKNTKNYMRIYSTHTYVYINKHV